MFNLKSKGVGILNASPLSMGLFTDAGPPVWHRAPDKVKEAARLANEYCKVCYYFFLFFFVFI